MGMAEDMAREDWSPREAVEAESPVLFQELTQALSDKHLELAKELDKGVAPDVFKKGQALLVAYDAALGGLKKVRGRRGG